MTAFERLVETLEAHDCRPRGSHGRREARCPAHHDRKPSLSVRQTDDRVLVNCQAGCDTADIVAALGLEMKDLFDESKNGSSSIVAEYDYVDEGGTLLYQVVRKSPKDFRQRRPDGAGGWVWRLDGVRQVVYRLPKVLDAVARGEDVMVVEGEKDVHALENIGVVATCNPAGAGKWRSEYNEFFRGANVTIVADGDDAGRNHAWEVSTALRPVAATVDVVEPSRGKDVAELIGLGGGLADLVEVAEPTHTSHPSPIRMQQRDMSEVEPIPVIQWREEDAEPVRWAWDGRIQIGVINSIVGDGGVGKGTLVSWIIARLTKGQLPGAYYGNPQRVLVVGCHEDGRKDTWIPRVSAASGDVSLVVNHDDDKRPLNIVDDIAGIRKRIELDGIGFVYLDQAQDNLPWDSNMNQGQDIRQGLWGLARLMRSLEIAGLIALHAAYSSRQYGIREAGTHQWRNVVRCSNSLGYHPEPTYEGVRVFGRAKGNNAIQPSSLSFSIAAGRFVIPKTQEVVAPPVVTNMAESDVRVEDIEFQPPRSATNETNVVAAQVSEIALGLLATETPRRRGDLASSCAAEGINGGQFKYQWDNGIEGIEKVSKEGRDSWFQAKS